MTKTKEITEFDRIEIIRLKESGKTVTEIAKEVSCAKSTVTYTIQRYKEHHTVVDLHRNGRKKIYTPRDQRSLINAAIKDPRKTSSQLAEEWKLSNGKTASSRTVRRILQEHDLNSRPVSKKTPKPVHKNR